MTPIGARVIAGALVLAAGGVVANVAYLQDGATGRRAYRDKVAMTPRIAAASPPRAETGVERPPMLQLASLTVPSSAARDAMPGMPARVEVARLDAWTIQAAAVQAAVNRHNAARVAMVREIQRELAKRGYEPGAADGEAGLVTKAAIVAFEHDQGLPETGEPNGLVHRWLLDTKKAARHGMAPAEAARTRNASPLARTVRQMLAARGYLPIRNEHLEPTALSAAIMKFEMENGLVPSGRISGPLAAALLRARNAPVGRVAASR